MKTFVIGFAVGVPAGIAAAYFYWAKAIAIGKEIYAHAEKDWGKAKNLMSNIKRLLPKFGK